MTTTSDKRLNEMYEIYKKLLSGAGECASKGHAKSEISVVKELADDRYYDIKLTRCSRCGIPLHEEYL